MSTLYNGTKRYDINGTKIELLSNETAYGHLTVAIVDGKFHHLGNRLVVIATAMELWETMNGRVLTTEERELILLDNGLKSSGI